MIKKLDNRGRDGGCFIGVCSRESRFVDTMVVAHQMHILLRGVIFWRWDLLVFEVPGCEFDVLCNYGALPSVPWVSRVEC